MRPEGGALKRLFDLSAAVIGIVTLSPLMALLAVLVKLSSQGPVLYRAARVGVGGVSFTMYKFRSMVTGADKAGPLVTMGGDPRVTRLGTFLRKTKLDELPSLWNVLLGEMSLVGPRPENPKSAALYTDEQKKVLRLRPGVTSLATVRYRNEEAILAGAEDLEKRYFEVMQEKLNLELEYLRRRSFRLDLQILWDTVLAVIGGGEGRA
jgi:lipopolysaccharide/colanic/teichoic acid biosynthesis glycosyltransferase